MPSDLVPVAMEVALALTVAVTVAVTVTVAVLQRALAAPPPAWQQVRGWGGERARVSLLHDPVIAVRWRGSVAVAARGLTPFPTPRPVPCREHQATAPSTLPPRFQRGSMH